MPSFLPDLPANQAAPVVPQPGQRPYVLFVGRLERIKGLQDVIPAFDETMPADLVIAGTGSYETTLRKLAAATPNVRFVGWCDPQQLTSLYRGARALIVPSKCYEVFPLVVLEAFQHSVPIIARRLGPHPEIVEKSQGGLLFDDSAEFADAVRALVSDGALRDTMGRAAQAAFHANWSESVALATYFDLIRAVAVRRGFDQTASAFSAPVPHHVG